MKPDRTPGSPEESPYVADTRRWLETAVIGLNLCPFARSVRNRGLVHFCTSQAGSAEGVLEDLARELIALADMEPGQRDTTLLIVPHCLADYLDFNDFLDEADALLLRLGLEGVLQIADFHPDYQFAGTAPQDPGNYTNRAPYPTLHLLREASIDKAVEAVPEAASIFERNIRVLEELGPGGLAKLGFPFRSQEEQQ